MHPAAIERIKAEGQKNSKTMTFFGCKPRGIEMSG